MTNDPHPSTIPPVTETLIVNFDGGSRGNPGPAGIGIVVAAEDATPLITLGKYIGAATNNVAEYMALINGLQQAIKLGAKKLIVRGDSELVIKQMRGEYRVKNPALKDLFTQAQSLLQKFDSVQFEHNMREHNSLADRLANLAMDRLTDVDDIDDMPSPASAPPIVPRVKCSNCGCVIEIKVPPRADATNNFICRCGNPMN